MATVEMPDKPWGLIGRAVLVGALSAMVLFGLLLVLDWSPRDASSTVFSLAALVFSVGLIGWSTVLMTGEAMERFSSDLGLSEGWTVRGGRQAMALLVAGGGGGMVGAAIAGSPFGV